MKYAIISTVISTIIAIVVFLIEFGFNKNDKYFISIILILLMISGVYFSVKDIKLKQVESDNQGITLENTLSNTENIKLKADSIITNLNESLDEVIKINDSVVSFNESLKNVQKDVSNQIVILENTLVQTKIFEQKVSEQLKIEKLRFQSESAKIIIPAKKVMFLPSQKDSTLVSLHSIIYNRGKRNAINVNSIFLILLLNDKKEVFKHEFIKSRYEFITPGDRATSESPPLFSKNDFGHKINSVIIAIQVKFKDEQSESPIQTDFIFRWNNLISDELFFSNAEIQYEKIALDYININNL